MASKSTISISFKLDGDDKSFQNLARSADGFKGVLQATITESDQLKKSLINWSQGVQAIDAITNTLKNVQSAFNDFNAGMRATQQENAMVSQLTGKTGEEMLRLRNSVKLTSEQFGTDFSDTMIAVNSLAKGFGITTEEAMKLMQDGFVSGANANGEFVDTLKEYPRYFKEAGLSAEEFVAITTNAAQQGIYSDKGVDVIKEGNLRIREMTKSTADALAGIGISAEAVQADLQNGTLTTFDVMQMVSAKLSELPANSAAVGAAIADIFGGPGEDAGLEYIQSLANVQLNMQAVKESAGEIAAAQEAQLQTQENLKNSFLGLIDFSAMYTNIQPYAELAAQAATTAIGIGSLVTTIKGMNIALATAKARTLAAAASAKVVAAASAIWKGVQVALNFVLSANPIGLVVMAIGALVTGVIAAYNHCEGFRKICDQVWSALKPLATAIMDGLAKAFEWLVEKCKEAWEWLKNILNLGGKKVEVKVNVKKPTTQAPATNFGDKYNTNGNTGGGTGGTGKTPKITVPKVDTSAADAEAAKSSEGIIGKLEEQIADARKRLKEATTTAAIEAINAEIEGYEAQLKVYENLGKTTGDAVKKGVEESTKSLIENATTLADISNNIEVLNKQLQTASIDEAAAINQQIKAWQEKADAIRNAGKEAAKTGKSTEESLRAGWSGIKSIGSAIEGIKDAVSGTGSAWEKLTGFVDGFLGLYDSFTKVIEIIATLTGITQMLTAAKKSEALATEEETGAVVAGAVAEVAASTSAAAAKEGETIANTSAAVSGALSAHSSIPFVGIAMGLAAAAAIIATMASIPKFAAGGIVSGPTMALVGEYGGASHNPEVIAPLNKLRGMLAPAGTDLTNLEFKIKGRTLVAVLEKEMNVNKRS